MSLKDKQWEILNKTKEEINEKVKKTKEMTRNTKELVEHTGDEMLHFMTQQPYLAPLGTRQEDIIGKVEEPKAPWPH